MKASTIAWLALGVVVAAAVALPPALRGRTPGPGYLNVVATAPNRDRLDGVEVAVRSHGTWSSLASGISVTVPAAPGFVQLVRAPSPAGEYDAVRIGNVVAPLKIRLQAGQIAPVLIGVTGGSAQPTAVYAGTDQFNLGLAEISGRLTPVPEFDLIDQSGRHLGRSDLLGRPVLLAAFQTRCQQTCPIYTSFFHQVRAALGDQVRLVEVTTEPAQDSVAAMAEYAAANRVDWTLLGGDPEAVFRFWIPFKVYLGARDSHQNVLVLIDEHGYARITYQGVPDIGRQEAARLRPGLSPEGQAQLAARPDFDLATVTGALERVARPAAPPVSGSGGPAPDFTLPTLAGSDWRLAAQTGRPVVINFWAAWCAPCRQELPMLQRQADSHPDVSFVLVDYLDDGKAAGELVRQLKLRVPVAVDRDGRVGGAYGVMGLPTTVFVRGDGSIEGVVPAALDERTLVAHLQALAG